MLDGTLSGHITYQCDVYAYAIVCVEIFGDGALPWSGVDDDAYRMLILGVFSACTIMGFD